jgi:peptidylprolyl isomerase
MTKAQKGDKVRVHYTGKLADGEVFDTSYHGSPLEFTVGSGELIKGFDDCVNGMGITEKRSVTIPPEGAYGIHHGHLVTDIPKDNIPDNIKPETGHYLEFKNHDGESFRALIIEILDDTVKVDLNHPLAGKELVFEIELMEIVPESHSVI